MQPEDLPVQQDSSITPPVVLIQDLIGKGQLITNESTAGSAPSPGTAEMAKARCSARFSTRGAIFRNPKVTKVLIQHLLKKVQLITSASGMLFYGSRSKIAPSGLSRHEAGTIAFLTTQVSTFADFSFRPRIRCRRPPRPVWNHKWRPLPAAARRGG